MALEGQPRPGTALLSCGIDGVDDIPATQVRGQSCELGPHGGPTADPL